MSKYVKHNQNPFGKKIGDCPVRALSLGLGIDYEEICEMLGKGFKEGVGLVGDVRLNDMKKFSKTYGLIKPRLFDVPFFDYVYRDEPYVPKYKWPTLSEFADTQSGKYVVLVRRSDVNMKHDFAKEVFKDTFHVVYVDGDKKTYYDNMNDDPGDMTVYGVFMIKN